MKKKVLLTVLLSSLALGGFLTSCSEDAPGPNTPHVSSSKSKLDAQIKVAEEVIKEESKFKPEGMPEFKVALENAKKVLADENATSQDIATASTNLTEAYNNLVRISEPIEDETEEPGGDTDPDKPVDPPVEEADKADLESEISKAEKKNTGTTIDAYLNDQAEYDAYIEALNKAKELLDKEDATQEEVDAATDALKAASKVMILAVNLTLDLNYDNAPAPTKIKQQKNKRAFTLFEDDTHKDGFLNIPRPTREGYFFAGWYTTKTITPTSKPYNFNNTLGKDVTLYAAWKDTSGTPEKSTYYFEGEEVHGLRNQTGKGYSGANSGLAMIVDREDAHNGRAVGYMNSTNCTLDFVIYSDTETTASNFEMSLSCEFMDLTLDPNLFSVSVNGTPVEYSPVTMTFPADADKTSYPLPFQWFKIADSIKLKAGENTITFVVANSDLVGSGFGTMESKAPIFDAIRFDTTANLMWFPIA